MRIIPTIKNSIYNPDFYSSLSGIPVKSSIKYYFKLVSITSIFLVISFIPTVVWLARPATFEPYLNMYPHGLEIKIHDGIASTNQPEPFIFKLPDVKKNSRNAFVIDTKTPFSVSQFDLYNTDIILKSDFLVTRNDSTHEVKLNSLSSVKDLTINETSFKNLAEKAVNLLSKLSPLLLVLVYMGFIIFYSFKLLFLFLVAFIVMFISHFMNTPLRYMKAYQVSLHAMTFALIVEFLTFITHLSMPPLIFTGMILVIVIINMLNGKRL